MASDEDDFPMEDVSMDHEHDSRALNTTAPSTTRQFSPVPAPSSAQLPALMSPIRSSALGRIAVNDAHDHGHGSFHHRPSEADLGDLEVVAVYSDDTKPAVKAISSPDPIEPKAPTEGVSVTEPTHRSTILGACLNFINSILGAGIIGLPFALREAGFYTGLLLLVGVACVTTYSVKLLVRLAVQEKKSTYEELAQHVFGRPGYLSVAVFMLLFSFGAMIAYLIIIGDTTAAVIGSWFGWTPPRALVIWIVSTIMVLPLSLVKNMAMLSHSSGASLFALAYIIIVVIARLADPGDTIVYTSTAAHDMKFIDDNFFPAIGVILFAFVCHHNCFFVYNSLERNTSERWAATTNWSVGVSAAASILLAVVGYITFVDETQANLLNCYSFNDQLLNATRLVYALTLTLTFPMEMFVARHCVSAIIWDGQVKSNLRHYLLSFSLWCLSMGIASTVNDLGFVLELTGALSASFIAFILPGGLSLWLYPRRLRCWHNVTPVRRILADTLGPWLLVVTGFLVLIVSTSWTIVNKVQDGQ